jgi:glycine oxidase
MNHVAIVGGGIIGLACAWRLAQRGCRVTLYDAAAEAREASWAAAGMLAPHHEWNEDTPLWRLGSASLARWGNFAAQLGGAEALDLHLAGGLLPALTAADEQESEVKRAFLHAQNVTCDYLDTAELARVEPALAPCRSALRLPAGQVDPRRTTAALRRACNDLGVDLRYGAAISSLTGLADQVVLASGAWTPALAALAGIALSGEPVKGQLLRFGIAQRLLRSFVHCHHAYLVPRADAGVVVGSTMVWSQFDKSEDDAAIQRLAESARTLLPALRDAPIVETWTGLRPRLASGLPLLARVRDDLVVATGHFRNGILLTPITADAVTELVLGESCGVDLRPFASCPR